MAPTKTRYLDTLRSPVQTRCYRAYTLRPSKLNVAASRPVSRSSSPSVLRTTLSLWRRDGREGCDRAATTLSRSSPRVGDAWIHATLAAIRLGVGVVSRSTVLVAATLALVLSGASGCMSPQAQPQSTSDPARVAVPTQSPWASAVACMDAALSGVLVADTRWGVAVARDQDGQVVEVVWPHGYFAGHDDGVSLYDEAGRLVGHAGDRVSLGGGYVVDGHVVELTWLACPGLAPVQSQPA